MEKNMRNGTVTFLEYFGKLSSMFCAGEVGQVYGTSPLEKFCLEEAAESPKGFTGILVMPDEFRARFAWLPERMQITGTVEKPWFRLEAELGEMPALPSGITFFGTRAVLVLVNEKAESDLYVRWEGKIGEDEGIDAVLTFRPLLEKRKTTICGNLSAQPGDAAVLLKALFGFQVDMASFVPALFPLAERIRPDRLELRVEGGWLENFGTGITAGETGTIAGASVRLYYVQESEMEIKLGAVSFSDPYLELGFFWGRNQGDNTTLTQAVLDDKPSISAAFGVTLNAAGIKMSFRYGLPYMAAEAEQALDSPVPLETAAQGCGIVLPSFLKGVSIVRAYFMADFYVSAYVAHLKFSAETAEICRQKCRQKCDAMSWTEGGTLVSEPETEGYALVLREASLRLAYRSSRAQVQLAAVLGIIQEEKMVCGFGLQGDFCGGSIRFKGGLVYNTLGLKQICTALFGWELPAVFPELTIQNLWAEGEIGDQISVSEAGGSLKLEMGENSPLGISFAAVLSARVDKLGFTGTGLFSFRDYFFMEVTLSDTRYSADGLRWQFALILGERRLFLTYNGEKKQLAGTLEESISLADMADMLMKIKNPSSSFNRTGAWSFLNEIIVSNPAVIYDYTENYLDISIGLQYKNAFADLTGVSVRFASTDVSFRLKGTVLGEEYTEEKPYAFRTDDPPEIAGKGFCMNYLALASGVSVAGLTGTSVLQDMQTVRNQWNKKTKVSELIFDGKAGFSAVMDFEAASMLKVQLLYLEQNDCCGGRFELYGEKAGALAGLSAELSYGKVTGQIGVFSGKIVPPKGLREIQMGAMKLSLGKVEAQIYTNGDFFLNLGFPENMDFRQSFAFSYGCYKGSGGICLKKSTAQLSSALPDTRGQGYFAALSAMGIGLKLSVGTSYRGGLLNAEALLVMQGCFEGMYATYVGNDGKSSGYYVVAAAVVFDGSLRGSVDFGIIGAAVSIVLHASAALALKSYEPTEVDISFQVQASAIVKVVFVKIRFGFSMTGYLHITLGSSAEPPWKSAAVRRGMFRLPEADGEEKKHFTLRLSPVFSRCGNDVVVNLIFLMESDDFEDMLKLLARVMAANDYPEATDGLELFGAGRFFDGPQQVYAMLEKCLVFDLEVLTEETQYQKNPVLVPLPEFFRQTVTTEYKSGQRDYSQRELETYNRIDDSYLARLQEYYHTTMEDGSESANPAVNDNYSVSARIFADFFELIIKSMRTEHHDSRMRGAEFRIGELTSDQLGNIQGMTNRFMLGGKRALCVDDRKADAEQELQGIYKFAGQQVPLMTHDRIRKYQFSLELSENVPSWLELSSSCISKEGLSVELCREKVMELSPAQSFERDIFKEPLKVGSFYEDVDEADIFPAEVIRTDDMVYYASAETMEAGVKYRKDDGSIPVYGGLFWLTLRRESEAVPMYSVQEYGGTREIASWREMKVTSLELLYPSGSSLRRLDRDCFLLQNGVLGRAAEPVYYSARLSEPEKWLRMVELSVLTKGSYFLGFEGKECPWMEKEELKVYCFVGMESPEEETTFQSCFQAMCAPVSEKLCLHSDRKQRRQTVPAGALMVCAETSDAELSEPEKRLYAMYNNMAAEIVYGDHVSHETISHIGRQMQDKTVYEIQIPYTRACGAENVYEMIQSKEAITVRGFLVDMLGNRMKQEQEVCWIPVYTDRLLGLREYEGLASDCSYSQKEDGAYFSMKLHYARESVWDGSSVQTSGRMKEEFSVDHLTEGFLQLEQPDVEITVQCSLSDEIFAVDKVRLLEFLRECVKAPEKTAAFVQEWKLAELEWTQAQIVPLKQSIRIARKAELCLKDGPAEIQAVEQSLVLEREPEVQPEAEPEVSERGHLRRKNSTTGFLKNTYLLRSNQMWFALRVPSYLIIDYWNKPVLYGFVPLGRVTGQFRTGTDEVSMSSIDLNAVLTDCLRDLQELFMPEKMYQIYGNTAMRGCLEDMYLLRENAAECLAARVYPLHQNDCGKAGPDVKKMQEYARDLFFAKGHLNRENLIFLQSDGVLLPGCSVPCRAHGIMGAGEGFSSSFSLKEQKFMLHGAVEAPDWINIKDCGFRTKYLEDEKSGQLLVPQTEEGQNSFLWLPFLEDEKIRTPIQRPPQAPVPISFAREKTGLRITMRVRGTESDELHLNFLNGKNFYAPQAVEADWVTAMECYREESAALLADLNEAGLRKLIELMKGCFEAVRKAPIAEDSSKGSHQLKFLTDGAGNIAGLRGNRDVWICGWKLRVYSREYGVVELQESGIDFCFPEVCMPQEGSEILLEIWWPYAAKNGQNGSVSQGGHGAQSGADGEITGSTAFIVRQRGTCSKTWKQDSKAFRLVGNKVEF